jgi:hypothetical protein
MRRSLTGPARIVLPVALGLGVAAVALPAAAETRSFDLPPFTGIDASAGVDVYARVGEAQSVEAEQKDGKFDQLELEVRDGVLFVSSKGEGWGIFGNRPRFEVRVSMESLDLVDSSAGADVEAKGIDSERVTVDVSSGADAELSGTCGRLDVDVSSGADADAEELVCEEVTVDASSGADAVVHATRRIDADASSGADIKVYGGPSEVEMETSSGGDVEMRD